jgi:dolichyl-diphosphooligosaccharide--protein glycosyltransferase
MLNINFKDKRTWFVFGVIIILSAVALFTRILPSLNISPNLDLLTVMSSDDPLYNLRQVEVMLANFPNYAWFDPMTLFPTGTTLNWGPLFPMIITIVCLLTGSVTRPEIIAVGLLIPPIMAAVMVPVMYYLGKICGDWKTGLLSASFIAVVSGQYFNRSFYGYMDHHIGEALFSSLFCFMYMYVLYREKDTKIILNDITTYKKTVILSILTGVAYLLGHFLMPTMILFAMIVAIFTIIQFIVDGLQGRSSEYLVVINTVTFAVAIAGILIFGIRLPGISLISYSIGHVYALLVLISLTLILYGVYLRFGQKDYFQAIKVIILSAAAVFIIVLALSSIVPQVYELFIRAPYDFFGQKAISLTIQESMPWSIIQAWDSFNYGIFLLFGGILIMLYKNFKSEHPYFMFGLVWTLIVLFSTWQHIRYEYYLAVPLTLVSAICVSTIIDVGVPHLTSVLEKASSSYVKKEGVEPESNKKKKKKQQRKELKGGIPSSSIDYSIIVLLSIIVIFGLLFGYISFSKNYNNALLGLGRMNGDWKESLDWMYTNTPDPGMDYTQIYSSDGFQYPSQAYGVMSWWDYGHMITTIAKRIPNANPFQQGVIGPYGAARFFMSLTEADGNKVLDNQSTRYIMTDIEMDTGKFWAMATWDNTTLGVSPYQGYMLSPTATGGYYIPGMYNKENYYSTMVSRLHNFDGSLVNPQTTYYVEYMDPSITQQPYPVINDVIEMNISDVDAKIDGYNIHAMPGYHATKVSPSIILPTHKIPALQHYRLIHESPSGVFPQGIPDLKYVKTFEYVKGARIPGNGLIEIDLISNTGRSFTYRQESVNGEFVLPYSTTGNPYEVKSVSNYRINGVALTYDIPERAVMDGGDLRQVT